MINLALVTLGIAALPLAPVGGKHGVRMYEDKGAAVTTVEADGELEAPPAEVHALLSDYAGYQRLVKRLAETRVLARGDHELYCYQRLKLPIIADRDYTLHVTWEARGATLWIHFQLANERGPAPRPKVVRMTTLTGSWELTPIRGGSATHARYHLEVDFAGSVPRGMVRDGAIKDLPLLFDSVRRALAHGYAPTPNLAGR